MERWSVSVERQDCKFSCAHFLIFPDGSTERLHGHNYQVACRVGGRLGEAGLVIEFSRLKAAVREICNELDEHWLLPEAHPELRVTETGDGHLGVAYRQRRYLAPADEVLLLPVANISAENLATWMGRRLLAELRRRHPEAGIDHIRLQVSEVPGQYGIYERDGMTGDDG